MILTKVPGSKGSPPRPAPALLLWVGTVTLTLAGCASSWREAEPFEPDARVRKADGIICTDATGHHRSARPVLLGGTCACTPCVSVLSDYQSQGLFAGLDVDGLIRWYREQGVKTDLEHRGCNNLCEEGPHVAFGGRCQATPTPATVNFEQVHGFGRVRSAP